VLGVICSTISAHDSTQWGAITSLNLSSAIQQRAGNALLLAIGSRTTAPGQVEKNVRHAGNRLWQVMSVFFMPEACFQHEKGLQKLNR
jgi:hypothetical protein